MSMNDTRNLIERLETALDFLSEAEELAENSPVRRPIDDALGVVGEVLTMIDGR